jgi:hypothetical protein
MLAPGWRAPSCALHQAARPYARGECRGQDTELILAADPGQRSLAGERPKSGREADSGGNHPNRVANRSLFQREFAIGTLSHILSGSQARGATRR